MAKKLVGYERTKEYRSRPENRERINENSKNYRLRNIQKCRDKDYMRHFLRKMEVLMHYSDGTLECAICGENRTECLSIDHVGGGGNKHRKEIGSKSSGVHFYKWLIDNDFPGGFRVLCMNCQFIEAAKLRG